MPESWSPTLEHVAAILRARTKDAVGNEGAPGGEGTFTETTRPTADQVNILIEMAVSDVKMRVGPDVPDWLHDSAQSTATLRAAQLVELSYYPERTDSDRTAYQSARLSYEDAADRLAQAIPRAVSLVPLEEVEEAV